MNILGALAVNGIEAAPRRVATLVLSVIVSCAYLSVAGAQSPWGGHCDSQLVQPAGDPYGYRARGDRCEGIYVKEVANTHLLVASFTESFQPYDPASGTELLIEWKVPAPKDVRLRAVGLRRRLYYRMDAVRPAGTTSYVWPTSLLAALKIDKSDLGVVGWITHQVGNTTRDLYVPLSVRPRDAAARGGTYEVTILPGSELSEVYVSVARLQADGRPGVYVKKDFALGYGYYPAARGIVIPVREATAPGLYSVEIGATLREGGSSTTGFWFFHGGG